MENQEFESRDEFQLPGEEHSPIWNDLHEFFKDTSDDFFEV